MQKNPFTESYEWLLNTLITTTGTTGIPNYENYSALVVAILGDDNNGSFWYVPKSLYGVSLPLYVSAEDKQIANYGSGFSISFHGRIQNGTIACDDAQYTGWGGINIRVYGIL